MQGKFAIGHSSTDAKTFLPEKMFDKASGIAFIDTAGLNDEAEGLL